MNLQKKSSNVRPGERGAIQWHPFAQFTNLADFHRGKLLHDNSGDVLHFAENNSSLHSQTAHEILA